MNGIVISMSGDLSSILNALNFTVNPRPSKRYRVRDLLRNGERKSDERREDRTVLAMLDSVHRDVDDARAAVKGGHRPEAVERMKHMFDVVDQIENLIAED